MRYLLLIHNDRRIWDELSDSDRQDWMAAHDAAQDEARRLGILVGCDALQPVSAALTVKQRQGTIIVTDGPFAETKEQLGGFYALDCDHEQAVRIAAMLPDARTGHIEVRAISAVPSAVR